MKLYEFGPTRSLRPLWVLRETGLPFEAVTVDMRKGEHRSPAFLAINPAGKLPALVDGDVVLTESVAIALYLAEKDPERRLLPAALDERAQVYRWLFFTATELEQALWRIARHTNVYPPERRVPADVPVASQDFREAAAVLEAHMEGRDFVVGRRITLADLMLAYTLDWAGEAGLLGDFPNLRAYLERLYARPTAAPRIVEAFRAIGVDPQPGG